MGPMWKTEDLASILSWIAVVHEFKFLKQEGEEKEELFFFSIALGALKKIMKKV